jgi:hypothetical protein
MLQKQRLRSDDRILEGDDLRSRTGAEIVVDCGSTGAPLAAFVCVLVASSVSAQVKSGDIIDKASLDKVKDLVSPGVAFFVKKGMTIKVVEPTPIGWPKAYRDATEKFSAQVKLASDGVSIENYTAGMPLPNVDPNDPKAALKIMWNYEYRPYPRTDDFVEFEFPVFSGALSYDRPMNTERQMLLGEVRRLYFNGRLVNDPNTERSEFRRISRCDQGKLITGETLLIAGGLR